MDRVLIFHREHLITGGVASLLNRESDFDVVEMSIKDEAFSVEGIRDIHPTVLISDGNLSESDLCSVIEILNQMPELRFIVVDKTKNLIHIYEKQEFVISDFTDLVNAIRGDRVLQIKAGHEKV